MATKKCPFCAEEIQAEAIKCTHCGEMLGELRTTSQSPSPEASTEESPAPPLKPWHQKGWVIFLLLLLFYPVGVVLLWMHKSSPFNWKVVGTVLFAPLFIAALMSDQSQESPSRQVESSVQDEQPLTTGRARQGDQDEPQVTWESYSDAGLEAQQQARHAEAEQLYLEALTEAGKFGEQDPRLPTSLKNLAFLYYTQGRYAEAETLYQRVLTINEKALGPEHPDVATTLDNLAGLYYMQGKYSEAETLYQRALAIDEKVLGAEPPDVAPPLNNLANLYSESEHPAVASNLTNLARLYQPQGKYAEAESLLQRALVINEKALGPEHPNTVNNLNDLAVLYQYQGKYAEAEPLYQRTLAIREKVLGPEHPRVVGTLANYAALLRELDRNAEADKLEERARAIRGEE